MKVEISPLRSEISLIYIFKACFAQAKQAFLFKESLQRSGRLSSFITNF
jgi:hypothetical protein